MASENTQPDNTTSCWKKTITPPEGSGFLDKVTAPIGEFVHTPLDQHKICLKKTMADFREFIKNKKLSFGLAKVDGAEGASGAKEIPPPTPAKATTAQSAH